MGYPLIVSAPVVPVSRGPFVRFDAPSCHIVLVKSTKIDFGESVMKLLTDLDATLIDCRKWVVKATAGAQSRCRLLDLQGAASWRDVGRNHQGYSSIAIDWIRLKKLPFKRPFLGKLQKSAGMVSVMHDASSISERVHSYSVKCLRI